MCDYCSWIRQLLERIDADAQERERKKSLPRVDLVIVVHGSIGKIPRYAQKFMLKEVKLILVNARGESDLIKGRSSVDAVERATCHMESKKYFNCAYGGLLDANKEVVMDAAMMTDGLRAGCVGAVRNIEHPITLAKKVLQQTEHVLIVENGAQKLVLESGIPTLPSGWLVDTSNSWTLLEEENDGKIQTNGN
ncbi:probable isoaspartyl peptidase/L-asparaginase GA20639 [Odontomachus brunneus]|uniref:probable isoaspartyl peptidase/L-asparaginase GA20639 n=1 Tax=Odontomachus brunneus TaxID=486640 RepID=UPI0013F1BCD1|nr:probable isoaspartyl peptidase/L-asparaginase GA20639 [Odontomachus brunneus]